jgi:ribosomal protein L24
MRFPRGEKAIEAAKLLTKEGLSHELGFKRTQVKFTPPKLQFSMPHLKKDDMVMIKSGDYQGKKGKVLDVNFQKKEVTIEGVNLVVKRYMDLDLNGKEIRRKVLKEAPISGKLVVPINPATMQPWSKAKKVVSGSEAEAKESARVKDEDPIKIDSASPDCTDRLVAAEKTFYIESVDPFVPPFPLELRL